MTTNPKKPVVLIVDDIYDNIISVYELLRNEYRIEVATNGKRALEIAKKTSPDIVLMDILMPVMDGYEACKRFKNTEGLKDIPILFLTSKSGEEDERNGLSLGAADYITKPVNPSILRMRIENHLSQKEFKDELKFQNHFLSEEVHRHIANLTVVQEASIMAMASLAETRDNETGQHLRRTKHYISELAMHMGKEKKFKAKLSPENIKLIALSSPLHDIGKIGIPDSILLKPGPLTADEYDMMKKHTIIGRNAILKAENLIGCDETFLSCARKIAYSHHEKWDGTGYPEGLSGEDIPLSARLMAVVDAYDALTSQRIYKEAVCHEEAVAIIRTDSGTHFDPDVIKAFLALTEEFRQISNTHKDDIVTNIRYIKNRSL